MAVKSLSGSKELSRGDLMDMGTIRLAESDFFNPDTKRGTAYEKGNDKGVVFWVNPANPFEGKIVSSWATNGKIKYVSDKNITSIAGEFKCKDEDGSVNIGRIKESETYKNAPSGTVWALDEYDKSDNGFADGGWYLPSTTELRYIFGTVYGLTPEKSAELKGKDVIQIDPAAYDRFNASLVATGGTDGAFSKQQYLWSSELSEDHQKVPYINFNAPANGEVKFGTGNNSFEKTCQVRCVKKVTLTY